MHAAGGSGDFRNEWNAVLSGGLDDGFAVTLPVTVIKVKNGKSAGVVRQERIDAHHDVAFEMEVVGPGSHLFVGSVRAQVALQAAAFGVTHGAFRRVAGLLRVGPGGPAGCVDIGSACK